MPIDTSRFRVFKPKAKVTGSVTPETSKLAQTYLDQEVTDSLIIPVTAPQVIVPKLATPKFASVSTTIKVNENDPDAPTPLSHGITNPKFSRYRRVQLEAMALVQRTFECDLFPLPTVILCIPTGGGKFLVAWSLAKQYAPYGFRTLILTHSKGLQDQAERDATMDGLQIMKGRSNYDCIEGHGDCETGRYYSCMAGPECTANKQKQKCLEAPIVLSNYAYWITTNRHLPGTNPIGQFNFIIMDEAHLAPEILSSHLTVTVEPDQLELLLKGPGGKQVGHALSKSFPILHESPKPGAKKINHDNIRANVSMLRTWATQNWTGVLDYHKGCVELLRERQTSDSIDLVRKAVSFMEDLKLLKSMDEDNWVVDLPNTEPPDKNSKAAITWKKPDIIVKASPIWVGKYNHYIFAGAQMKIMTSATVLPKTGTLMGIPQEQMVFKEWPRQFSSARNPVYYCGRIDMNYHTEKDPIVRREVAKLGRDIATIWQFDKGIIQCQSYERMDWMYEEMMRFPELRDRLMRHEKLGPRGREWRESGQQLVDRYLKATGPVIAMSPVLSTGWDFADDSCRWIWLPKIPLQPARDLVTRVRVERDPGYTIYAAVIELCQSVGRNMRHEKDWGVSIITDTTWGGWFGWKSEKLRPKSLVIQNVGSQLPKRLVVKD